MGPDEDDTVDVLAPGRKVRVRLHPAIKAPSLRPGQELVLNEALNVDVVVLKERLDDDALPADRSGARRLRSIGTPPSRPTRDRLERALPRSRPPRQRRCARPPRRPRPPRRRPLARRRPGRPAPPSRRA